MSEIINTFITVLFSGGFLAFLQFLISRFDKKHDKLAELKQDIDSGLAAVRKTSDERYNSYCSSLESAETERKNAYKEIMDAIQQLVTNDEIFTKHIESISEKQNNMASASVGLIHNAIINFTTPIIERGEVTYEELATLDSLYIPYAKLGGNGECKRRYNDVNGLKKISEEDAIVKDRAMETRRFIELHKSAQRKGGDNGETHK